MTVQAAWLALTLGAGQGPELLLLLLLQYSSLQSASNRSSQHSSSSLEAPLMLALLPLFQLLPQLPLQLFAA